MAKQVTIEVDEAVYNVLGAVAKAITDIKAISADAQSTPIKITEIMTALGMDLVPVLGQIGQIPSEIAADKAGALTALAVQGPALLKAILG